MPQQLGTIMNLYVKKLRAGTARIVPGSINLRTENANLLKSHNTIMVHQHQPGKWRCVFGDCLSVNLNSDKKCKCGRSRRHAETGGTSKRPKLNHNED